MTPEQRRARGYAAKALFDDPTIQAALDEIEEDIRTEWETCGARWGSLLARRRERLWIELRTVKTLRQKIASFAGQARD